MRVSFTVPGKPQGKERPRFANGHTYTPSKTKAYEERIAWLYKQAGGKLTDSPVEVTIIAYFDMPKSWSREKREALAGEAAMCKVDADNIAKIVLDGLNGVAYKDDKQVTSLFVQKMFCTSNETAGVFVRVEEV